MFKPVIFYPRLFCPFFFFYLLGQRASRDITLTGYNWSNGKKITQYIIEI